ncbi:MAG: PQQ-like beta-propeller repeat protein [Lentisphaerae bacterium]|nr:PQQ-like beta-propeller repeat protein [Lentisphaerota bacterium]
MKHNKRTGYTHAVVMLMLAVLTSAGADPGTWPQWRGPLATGVAPDANPPVKWGEDMNIRWKVPVPGLGHSSPIVWKDRIFLTAAVETDEKSDPAAIGAIEAATPQFHRRTARMPRKVLQFTVLALNRSDGSLLWKRTVCEEAPHAATHADGSWASGSPVTDGERVYAYFGSQGLYALDMKGRTLWKKRFGPLTMKANFGEGTSPVLCGDALILNQDQEGQSFIVALDRKTGEELWKADRDEATSWSTPLVVEHDGRRQVVTSATKRMRSYDAASGALLWEAGGMTGNVIPCPVAEKGLVFCMSGFRGSALSAIRLDGASGDLAGKPEALAWSRRKDTPYVPSPLLYDGLLYFLKASKGILTCVDAATGKEQYDGSRQLKDMGTVYASPVGAAGRVYVTGKDGLTCVIRQGPAFEVLARNKLDDEFSASAAVAGEELFLRGHTNLYCIAARPTGVRP